MLLGIYLMCAVVTLSAKQIKEVGFSKPKHSKCTNKCQVCPVLPKGAHCKLANVVYEATCKQCTGNYIGKTSNCMYDLLSSHKSDLVHHSEAGPLSAHMLEFGHSGNALADFRWKIILRGDTPIDTAIKESMAIKWLQPSINRKGENMFLE